MSKSLFRSAAAVVVLAAIVLSGCGGSSSSSGSTTTAGSGGGPNGTNAPVPARVTGAYSGTAVLGLCTGDIGSLRVTLNGEASTYLGSVSAQSAGFVGPAAAAFTAGPKAKLPTVDAAGTTFDVDGVTLTDAVSHQRVTLHGTLTCP